MKRLAVVLLAGLGLAACGGTGHKPYATTNPQVQQQEQAAVATADQAVQRCLPQKDGAPDVLVLKSHDARQKFMTCAIPPAKRTTFDACVSKVVLSGLPTKARLKSGFESCLAEVER